MFLILCVLVVGTGTGGAEVGTEREDVSTALGTSCHSTNGTGFISGVFFDAGLNSISGTVDYDVIETGSGGTVASGSSSTDTYTIEVPAGEYYVRASADGYQTGESGVGCVTDGYTVNLDVILQQKSNNSPPTADAGSDLTVSSGETATLDATGSSDPDGDSLSYYWNGTQYLSDTNSATPTFDAPTVESRTTYTANLLVEDGNGGSDTDSVDVTVEPGGQPSFRVASMDAPSSVMQGETLFVDAVIENAGDGSGSETVEYRLDGTTRDTLSPVIEAGEQLAVTLGYNTSGESTGDYTHGVYTGSDSATASVTIEPRNGPPTADAGSDRTVEPGETVTLDGTGSSDPEGEALSYTWTSPDVSTTLTEATPTWNAPEVDGEASREVTFTLEVRDASGGTDTDEVTITAERVLEASVTFNEQSQPSGESVLVESASLSDGGFLVVHRGYSSGEVMGVSEYLEPGNYSGVRIELDEPLETGNRTVFVVPYWDSNGNEVYDLPEEDSVDPPYRADDGSTLSAGTTVTVNRPPTAEAGDEVTVAVGSSVALAGSGSDPDGDALTYSWERAEGDGAVDIADPADPETSVEGTEAGVVVLQLTVTDDNGGSATDTVTVEVVSDGSTSTPSSPTTTTTTPPPSQGTTTAPPGGTMEPPASVTTTDPASGPGDSSTGESSPDTAGDDEMDLPLVPLGAGLGTLVVLGGATVLWRRRKGGPDDGTLPTAGVGAEDSSGGQAGSGAGGGGGASGAGGGAAASDAGSQTGGSASDGTAGAGGVAGAGAAAAAGGADDDERESGATPTGITYEDIERGERIGSGGNADVYRGTVQGPHGPVDVALKEPRIEGTVSTADVEQVLEEAETWHKLDDDGNIVDVLGWGAQPLPWIAMEYMDGGNLATAPDLGYERGVEVLQSVASAVEYAHRAGIAHGDLKPANVLFVGDPETGTAKVGDWGLAKVLLEHSRSTEGLSPAYAAPEQFQGGSQDIVGPQLTDIYQLGAVAYEVLTGEPPFEGTPFEVMEQVKSEPPTPPTEVDPSLPAAVDDVVTTAMAKDPEDRYEAMLDFRRALGKL